MIRTHVESTIYAPLGRRTSRTARRRRFAAAGVVFALLAMTAQVSAAQSTAVLGIEGEWVQAPAEVTAGDGLLVRWRIDVAPDPDTGSSAPVENVTAELTLENGTFAELPDVCLTDGVAPPSTMSEDGATLTCNVGSKAPGSTVVETSVTATDAADSAVTGRGAVGADEVHLPPIAIAAAAEEETAAAEPGRESNALAGPPEYEITGSWIDPPATIGRGDPVVAEWHVNVNDSGEPPGNDPVDNVMATFALDKAIFDALPDICLTTGVDPPSSISADGMTLTCNFGTMNAGTAIAVQTPVVVTGLTGEEVVADGTNLDGETVTLPPIPIQNTFAMDIHYGQNVSYYAWNADYSAVKMNFEWSLRLGKGSDPGPQTITYRLDMSANGGATDIQVGTRPGTGEPGCTYFAFGATLEHPYSEHPGLPAGHPQETNFVDSCLLVETSPNVFELTLTGIDYSLMNIPTMDSAGSPLPTDWSYIASGQLWFDVVTTNAGSLTLDSNEPIYTSTTGLQATDLAANNTTSKAYTLPGSWSAQMERSATGSGGSAWDDSYRLSAGTQYRQQDLAFWGNDITFAPPTAAYGQCEVIDYQHASLLSETNVAFQGYDADGSFWRNVPESAAFQFEYYVGSNDLLTPGDGVYDPSSFSCGTEDGGWTTTPADMSAVKAVRVRYPLSSYQTENVTSFALIVLPTLHDDVPVGTDVWSFGSFLRVGEWNGHQPEFNPPPPGGLTPTPGARYPNTNSRRDLLRIVGALPAIQKAAAEATVTPGVPVEFTLTYSANGAGAIPPTVDGYQIVDTLPLGMTYEPGSADPEPTVSINGSGQQVLTWTLDDVPTNVGNTLTYEAVADSSVAPGERLTNVATSSYDGQTSRPASSTVTMSTNGYTTIVKMATDAQVQITDDTGTETLPWTVTITSFDPLPQAFTDTIDILPYNGDQRGTSFNGDYALDSVVVPAGATVYYTTADPTMLSDDPGVATNGAAPGDPTGNTVGWTTAAPADLSTVTAIRVIGPELPSGDTFQFQVLLETSGAEPGDVYVNRAQARAEHTELPMRTSALIELYEDELEKELASLDRNADGTYTAVFEISNTRHGNGPGYDLSDTLQYGDSVTLNGVPTAANVDPGDGSIAVVTGWDAGTETLTIAEDVPIADGVTHVYTVTTNVTVDGDTASFANTNCALEGQESGTGLLNTATLDVEDVEKTAPACAELPYVDHTKVLSGGPTAIGGGLYEVEYTIEVTNAGAADDVYDLSDRFRFGEAITIEGTPTVVNTVPGDIATLGTWDAATTTIAVVADEPIAGSTAAGPEIHTYVVTAQVSVDAEEVTFANTDCDLGSESGTGLFNETTLTVDEHVTNDDACGVISEPTHDKTVSGDPVPVGGGLYEVEYSIDVTNAGAADSVYDLVDTFRFGEAITIVGTPTVTNTVPGDIATLGTWDPAATTLAVVVDEAIAAGTAVGPETHTYTVTVQVSVDGELATFENTDCTLGAGESGSGLLNETTLTVNDEEATDDACPPPPPTPTHEKDLTSGPTPLGGGQYEVGYTIMVSNASGSPGTYDLDDALQYGEAVTIVGEPVLTAPAGIATNPAWDGVSDTSIVTGAAIAGGTAAGPEVHTYTVTVVVSVDGGTLTFENSDCTTGEGEAGTGLFNTSTMTSNGAEEEDDACAELPKVTHTKDLTSGPTSLGDGRYELGYTITVTNSGAGEGLYDLDDRLLYGSGITVEGAQVVNAEPGDIDTNGGWNGLDDIVVVEGQSIDGGTATSPTTHTYTVTVIAVAPAGALTPAAADCVLSADEGGTGFYNETTMTTNDVEETDDACAEIPPGDAASGGLDRPGSGSGPLARTGAAVGPLALLGLVLLCGSVVLLDRRRRLRATTP